eukprot:CAMPEP_0168196936 /NCGR_PEP_ID=MMETSP0139_2-20121125/20846_1 /TAXON_ID=44445 /ORGANISM="Pseudo-nitzschia australis, Strain 10249 10 AB" /LENGTH=395 /DNA_ID=CAMNT_0008121273 /DNA_START=44 /DNA_END=1232 /DNA_ORIENTATION=-
MSDHEQLADYNNEDNDNDTTTTKNPSVNSSSCCCPALFISAPASGQGKTTITASLARLLHRKGKTVRIFKFGPDYLDPQVLEKGSNAPVVQLDLWMAGEEWCRLELFRAVTDGKADIILIEGAMGLFDGTPSSADLPAAKFGIPVILIMNVKAMAQTAAAIAVGLRNYRDNFQMIGVIANHCGSNYHAKLVGDALPDDLPLLSALKHNDDLELPERHLGLVQPSEMGKNFIEERLEIGADLLEESGIMSYIDRLEQIPFDQPQLVDIPNPNLLTGTTIAIAHDDAFSFTYTANITLLQDMGATVCYFSPTHDDSIPSDANALWLPGGYPELHARELSDNTNMLSSLRCFHEGGYPILAECGGFLYCMETLIDLDGNFHSMLGLLPGVGTMKSKGG